MSGFDSSIPQQALIEAASLALIEATSRVDAILRGHDERKDHWDLPGGLRDQIARAILEPTEDFGPPEEGDDDPREIGHD